MNSIPLDWPSRPQPSLRLLERLNWKFRTSFGPEPLRGSVRASVGTNTLLRRRALPAAELAASSELDSMVRRSGQPMTSS
jgi:hypothetical protein